MFLTITALPNGELKAAVTWDADSQSSQCKHTHNLHKTVKERRGYKEVMQPRSQGFSLLRTECSVTLLRENILIGSTVTVAFV